MSESPACATPSPSSSREIGEILGLRDLDGRSGAATAALRSQLIDGTVESSRAITVDVWLVTEARPVEPSTRPSCSRRDRQRSPTSRPERRLNRSDHEDARGSDRLPSRVSTHRWLQLRASRIFTSWGFSDLSVATSTRDSSCAWATSIRSNGSRWWSGRPGARSAWATEIANSTKPAASNSPTRPSGYASLPKTLLLPSSHGVTAESPHVDPRESSSASHQSATCLSRSNLKECLRARSPRTIG